MGFEVIMLSHYDIILDTLGFTIVILKSVSKITLCSFQKGINASSSKDTSEVIWSFSAG